MAKIGAAAGAALLLVIILMAGAAAGVASMFGFGSNSPPTQTAAADIPAQYLVLDMQAAATCPGLPWSVLAGIGKAESDFGRAKDQVSDKGAVGPMQFLPDTFTEYAQPIPPGGANPPTPWDPVDAIYAAARLLCANGAKGGTDIPGAIYAYNHSEDYVKEVLDFSAQYTDGSGAPQAPPGTTDPATQSAVVAKVLAYARAQLGVPYQWGGNGPAHGQGFDCSGLVQQAYAAAGATLPRVATDQYHAGKILPPGTPLQPGDLVFFGNPQFAHHVGIYAGNGLMINAPNTGSVVRYENYNWPDYFAATRPAARP
jgi:cell wall-associated NlpC family hydrolase